MTAPAGWYPDSTGAPRWWDGQRWGETYVVHAASPGRAAPGTRADTLWVWLVVALPVLGLIPMLGYLFEVKQGFFDIVERMTTIGAVVDPSAFLAWEVELLFGPWAIISMVAGWVSYGLSVWFAARDGRVLARRGFVRPFHWAWAFLWSAVYVIGRHVVIRRQGGRGAGPLVATIITQAAVIVVAVIWNVAIVVQFFQTPAFWPFP